MGEPVRVHPESGVAGALLLEGTESGKGVPVLFEVGESAENFSKVYLLSEELEDPSHAWVDLHMDTPPLKPGNAGNRETVGAIPHRYADKPVSWPGNARETRFPTFPRSAAGALFWLVSTVRASSALLMGALRASIRTFRLVFADRCESVPSGLLRFDAFPAGTARARGGSP